MQKNAKDIEPIYAIGLMSGTSLDGVDIAFCKFTYTEKDFWRYEILKAKTVPYTTYWKEKLIAAETMLAYNFLVLHKEYGVYLGSLVNEFLQGLELAPNFIASHGHTIFHRPIQHITFQLGDGAFIAASTNITTISDFRNLDVALGGQGAPLVPIGDQLLFGSFRQCLNLGGFANISSDVKDSRIAFDICPVNIVLNYLMRSHFQKEYDKDGDCGRRGELDKRLLRSLDNLDFYKISPPKSLGKEWVIECFMPLMAKRELKPAKMLRTVYEHIANQVSYIVNNQEGSAVLVTGGGAYNKFLMELIQQKCNKKMFLPDNLVIDFKEALIFAFLGVLRYKNHPNCLSLVTGARYNNIGGVINLIN